MPSFIWIHPTVWPHYTSVTDRTDRQRSDSIGRTVLQTVAQKLTERPHFHKLITEQRKSFEVILNVIWIFCDIYSVHVKR